MPATAEQPLCARRQQREHSRGGERNPDLGHVTSRGPRQAQLEGFDLHANVWVPPNNRPRLEQLCRYLLRPPLAQDRVRLRADGRILVDLKTVWRDGTAQLLFEPIEFMEKLAAIIPRPAVNLLVYLGVLALHARTRSPQVVRYGRPAADPTAPEVHAGPRRPQGAWTWPALMRRVRPRCPTPVPAVAAGCSSSPSCRTRPSCGPSSPTSTARSPLRRLAPPHPPLPRSSRLPARYQTLAGSLSRPQRHRRPRRHPVLLQGPGSDIAGPAGDSRAPESERHMKLTGKTAIVTVGGTGIGESVSPKLAAHGVWP